MALDVQFQHPSGDSGPNLSLIDFLARLPFPVA